MPGATAPGITNRIGSMNLQPISARLSSSLTIGAPRADNVPSSAAAAGTDMCMVPPMRSVMPGVRSLHVVALIDAEHAFHATNGAADRSPDDGTDRTGDAIAFIKAVNGASGNALRLCGERHGEDGETGAADEQFHFHSLISIWLRMV